jgi:phosphoenolpyruvate-protein kinase (PTS system EI component)
MVETPTAAALAPELAAASDFLSIGTNDLAAETLGADRFGGTGAPVHHPAVLRCIAQTARAAAAAGLPLEVCGEAASDPVAMPLLVGLGVGELSVGAARLGLVRAWIGALDRDRAAAVAERALALGDADAVARLVRAELGAFAEGADAAGQGAERLAGVRAVGA